MIFLLKLLQWLAKEEKFLQKRGLVWKILILIVPSQLLRFRLLFQSWILRRGVLSRIFRGLFSENFYIRTAPVPSSVWMSRFSNFNGAYNVLCRLSDCKVGHRSWISFVLFSVQALKDVVKFVSVLMYWIGCKPKFVTFWSV